MASLHVEIGTRLKVTRDALLLKPTVLAGILGISPQRWHQYEKGVRRLDVEIAVRLCRLYDGLTMDWLIMGRSAGLDPALRRRLQQAARERAELPTQRRQRQPGREAGAR